MGPTGPGGACVPRVPLVPWLSRTVMPRFGRGWVVLAAGVLAAVTARPYAGAWNDGSRLAAVESLVDRHTFAIDDSVYLTPSAAARPPYDPANALAAAH